MNVRIRRHHERHLHYMLFIIGHLGLGFWVGESRLYLEEEVFCLGFGVRIPMFIVQCMDIGNARASVFIIKGFQKGLGRRCVSIYVWRWAERRLDYHNTQ